MLKQEIPDPFVTAAIGLGGNLGEPRLNMTHALEALNNNERTDIISVSSIYQTPPWGNEQQPLFLNACALINTRLSSFELLKLCLGTETKLGRERKERWGPRTIDLDILFYGDEIISSDQLTVPHPRMLERAFVLIPLAEICPNKEINAQTVAMWAHNCDREGIEAVVDASEMWWQA